MAKIKKVAFLYEGVSAEDKLLHNLQKVYFAGECEIDKYKSSFTEKSAYEDYNKLDKELWDIACKASVRRASLIVKDTEECTYDEFIENITQIEIYHAQKEKYINNKTVKSLAILNSVPLFVVEYFDEVLL